MLDIPQMIPYALHSILAKTAIGKRLWCGGLQDPGKTFRSRDPRTTWLCIVQAAKGHFELNETEYLCYIEEEWLSFVEYAPLKQPKMGFAGDCCLFAFVTSLKASCSGNAMSLEPRRCFLWEYYQVRSWVRVPTASVRG